MADNMMRVSGRSDVGQAKPIRTDENGNLQVVENGSIGSQTMIRTNSVAGVYRNTTILIRETDKPTIIDFLEFSTNYQHDTEIIISAKTDGLDEYAQGQIHPDGEEITDGWVPVSSIVSYRGGRIPNSTDSIYVGDWYAHSSPYAIKNLKSGAWEELIFDDSNYYYKFKWVGMNYFPKGVKVEVRNVSGENTINYSVNLFGRVFQ